MNSEPTLFVEAIRTAMLLAASFGLVLTQDQQHAIIAAVPAIFAVVSIALAWFNRNKVFAPDTTQRIANRAAETGNTDIGKPPDGSQG